MTRIQEIQQQANELTDREKATLAAELLEGLPAILDDEDGGFAEAQRRDAEMESDPNLAMSWEQLKRGLGR